MLQVENDRPENIFSFVRKDENAAVLILLNLSSHAVEVTLNSDLTYGEWQSIYTENGADYHLTNTVSLSAKLSMCPWGFSIFIQL
jgi:hypothetical protein